MPPRLSIDDRLRLLREIRNREDIDEIRGATKKALTDSCNLVIADAVKLIGEFELSGMEPDLLATWDRLTKHSDPIKSDKSCSAKSAIIESLGRLNYDEPDFYLAAIGYRQIEPAWPQAEDTAENVRAGCAFALAASRRLRIVDKLNAFVDYLQGSRADRINAAKAIADTGSESALPLLRLKLHSGDGDAEVMGVCMSGLLQLATDSSIPVVAEYLTNPSENVVLEAAAALGTCGRPKAVEALIATCKRTVDEEMQRSLLLSIGMSRSPMAVDYLIEQLESGENPEAAMEALKPACVYEETRSRVRKILDLIGNRNLRSEFNRKFGSDTDS